ncbi:MAG TPA: hypothetical protein VIV15_04465, partial [Anaerolineales bacterium]
MPITPKEPSRATGNPISRLFHFLAFPFRAVGGFRNFLNAEPEEHALGDVVAGVVTDQAVRQLLW